MDLLLVLRNDSTDETEEWLIYANDNSSDKRIDITHNCRDYDVHLIKNSILNAVISRQPCILECGISIVDNKLHLIPERERSDKNAPNALRTIHATIKNVVENITSEEMIHVMKAL